MLFFTNSLAFYNGPSSTFFPSNEMDTQPGSFFFFSFYSLFFPSCFITGSACSFLEIFYSFLFLSFPSFLYYFIFLYSVYGERGSFYVMWKRKKESCFIITVSFVSWFAYGFASQYPFLRRVVFVAIPKPPLLGGGFFLFQIK